MSTVVPISIKTVAQQLSDQVETVAKMLLPNGKREGQYWVAGDVNGSEGKSLRVYLSGTKRGLWADFAVDNKHRDLVDLWEQTKGIKKSEAIKEAKDYLGIVDPAPVKSGMRQLNSEYNKRLVKRLSENAGAMQYLKDRQLGDAAIARFNIGLSQPYKNRDGETQQDALVFPLKGRNGSFYKKYGYYNIPGVTQNPIDQNGWMSGSPMTYFADKVGLQKYLFVCEGIKDVWRHWEMLHAFGRDKDYLVISSTHGSGIPEEWRDPLFWSKYDAVLLGHDNDDAGDAMAEKIAVLAQRDVFRVEVPKGKGKDWTDFWNEKGSVEEFDRLVANAPVVTLRVSENNRSLQQIGRLSYDPIDIDGAFHNGHLYYTAQTLNRERAVQEDGSIGIEEQLETIVIRSDKTTHIAVKSPAPRGTPDHARVIRLSDGTLISKMPKPNSYGTWRWSEIANYINGKSRPRSLAEILSDIHAVLKKAIWLPYPEDYAVLALTVPVTYVQSVFDSVPLILMNGPAGSGKTQMGITMSNLCANGNIIGQTSAATVARHIDECRGFVVLDDLEAIGSKSGRDAAYGELVQALKVSYNKHSAVKVWTDVKTMKTERLNFFGVKMINNTQGADSILGSRMLRVQTRKIPAGLQHELQDLSLEDLDKIARLRQELHTWAFENVNEVNDIYRLNHSKRSDRSEEIAAPLRVMAQLADSDELKQELETALARQDVKTLDDDTPEDILKEALYNLVVSGYSTVTLTHISNEMGTLLDANFGQESKTEIPEWSRPEWIGKTLRGNDLSDQQSAGRKRFFGKNLRLVKIADWFVENCVTRFSKENDGLAPEVNKLEAGDFCRGCDGCRYRATGCELMSLREQIGQAQKKGGKPGPDVPF